MTHSQGPQVRSQSLGGHLSPLAETLPDITAIDWSAVPRSLDERELIGLMRREPGNLDYRLIYACYLHDQGSVADEAKAALLRYMCDHEQFRLVYEPHRYTTTADGQYVYRRIAGENRDGRFFSAGRLMLSRGLISEAVISSALESEIPGTWLVASALRAHPVERLVLEHTTEQVAGLLEQGRVMDGVRTLVLNGAKDGGRLGALAPRLDNVSCSLADAGEICRAPTRPTDLPSDGTRVLSSVTISKLGNAEATTGPWRLLGRDVTLRGSEIAYSPQEIRRFVEPTVTHSLCIEAIVTPEIAQEIGRLGSHLEQLSLSQCLISDDSWKVLLSHQFPKLREIQLYRTDAPFEFLNIPARNEAAKDLA